MEPDGTAEQTNEYGGSEPDGIDSRKSLASENQSDGFVLLYLWHCGAILYYEWPSIYRSCYKCQDENESFQS